MHSYSDLFSALQKFIRRGMDNDVLEVANELCNRIITNYDVSKWNRIWRRLHIIASEDIGVAQRGTRCYLANIREIADPKFHSNDKEEARRLCLEAVLTLCRSPKSRLIDSSYIYFSRQPPSRVCSEYLYQYIKDRDEVNLLQLIASIYRQRKNKQHKLQIQDIIQAVRENVSTDLQQELESIVLAYQLDHCVLYIMHLGLLITRPQVSHSCVPQMLDTTPEPLSDELLPDFVYDKHTKRGRETYQRGLRHFLEDGCVLSNCHIADPYYARLLRDVH